MAAIHSPIELPTQRQSKYYAGPLLDVYDPNYIPVLNGADVKTDYSSPSFSAFPNTSTPHTNLAQTSLKRSPSGSAPETVVDCSIRRTELTKPVPVGNTIPQSPQEIGSSWELPNRHGSTSSRSAYNTGPASEASTGARTPGPEEQVFMIPGNAAPRSQTAHSTAMPHSTKSSISSSRKVPTSKFNNRPISVVPNLPSNSLHHAMKAAAPVASRVESPDLDGILNLESMDGSPQFQTATKPPNTPLPAIPRAPPTPNEPPRVGLSTAKSTASQRRNRALHSHPSNVSLKSRRNSTQSIDEAPLAQTMTITKSQRPRSRAESIAMSKQATPAPQSPLPDLPPGAIKRPPTRERKPATPQQSHPLSTTASPQIPQSHDDHAELTDYMLNKQAVVFRRFDNMHVKLLLQLQDEIAAHEKEIVVLEHSTGPDQLVRKTAVMRDLRKALAEYGELIRLSLFWIFTDCTRSFLCQLGVHASEQSFAANQRRAFEMVTYTGSWSGRHVKECNG